MMVLKLLQYAVVAPCFMTDATQYYISHYYTYFYINNQRLTCSLVDCLVFFHCLAPYVLALSIDRC